MNPVICLVLVGFALVCSNANAVPPKLDDGQEYFYQSGAVQPKNAEGQPRLVCHIPGGRTMCDSYCRSLKFKYGLCRSDNICQCYYS
ncbi:uncharacterized protein LOC129724121 [Wyeomyia smithii]|uniref:uncharacterized protein LOC129724121 n=1 Tax=Wyeomyia smithii TaxID=174621 RepID=UPI002467C1D3|nr:uncharacterized protein LOC129724121 [Wyeomyia smithii]